MVYRYPASVRAQIRSQLVEMGAPPDAAGEAADLAVHAAEQAIDTAWRICRQGGDEHVLLAALGPAFSLIAATAPEIVENLGKFAADNGLATCSRKVRV